MIDREHQPAGGTAAILINSGGGLRDETRWRAFWHRFGFGPRFLLGAAVLLVLLIALSPTPEVALQTATDGVRFGLVIALCSVGLSLIFATTGLVNFAHGAFVAFGAIVAYAFNAGLGLSLVLAGILSAIVGGLFGGGLELAVFRPLRRRRVSAIALVVVTVGIDIAMRNILLLFFGAQSKPYTEYNLQQRISIGPVSLAPRDIGVIVVALVVLISVALLLRFNRIGRAIRSVSDDRTLAEATGISSKRVILVVWIVAGSLASIGGVALGLTDQVNWDMGTQLLLLMFAAVILGGIGSPYGAMAGGLVVGVAVQVSTLFVSSELKFAVALVVLILSLLIRPQGIFGRAGRVG